MNTRTFDTPGKGGVNSSYTMNLNTTNNKYNNNNNSNNNYTSNTRNNTFTSSNNNNISINNNHCNDDDDIHNEILVIAKAYRDAHEGDTLETMRVQNSRKSDDASKLFFYVIEEKWLRRAWPMLHGVLPDSVKLESNWREVVVQQITNVDLLVKDHSTDDEEINNDESTYDESDGNDSPKQQRQQPPTQIQQQLNTFVPTSQSVDSLKKPKTNALQSNSNTAITMLHNHLPTRKQQQYRSQHSSTVTNPLVLRDEVSIEDDYFLVGSNVWLLLKHKFGFDYEIKFSCTFLPGVGDEPPSLAVNLRYNNVDKKQQMKNMIKVPDSGRFPYEKHLGKIDINVNNTGTSTNVGYSPSFQKLSSPSWRSPVEMQHQAQQVNINRVLAPIVSTSTTGNNVSDDDDGDGGDNDHDTEIGSVSYGPLEANDSSHASSGVGNIVYSNDNPDTERPILLPPSETFESRTRQETTNRVDTMEDEYDYDEDDADDYDDKASDIISGGVAMSTNITVPRRRLYGSGLGNLGNTCFMNSTLQCLAHTEPLQRYFLSGEYERDLNRDNPLGTGGELAIQFAKLLKEMYIVEPPRALLNSNYTNVRTNRYMTAYNTPSNDFSSTSNVVYPRSFKNTLGKHAEQFMGYDQHDSQELATYLLDALHEDTNRVTIKPYVEKPEQGENESDEEAARKAWELHLKREDSRVLENFMGLVKSRVECNTPGCGRVSTTFDPVMYLSVPIPGSSERVLQVTYVPLEPSERPKNLFISIAKTANVGELLKKVQAQVADQFPSLPKSSLEDLCATDISWQKEVNSWFSYKDEIEYIREHDTTFVYELRSEKEIRKLHDEKQNTWEAELATAKRLGVQDCNFVQRYQLDPSVESSLCSDEGWDDAIHNYFQIPAIYSNAFNRRKGITDERVRIYRRLVSLIDTCHKVTEDATATGQKRTREENEQKKKRCASSMLPSQEYNYDIDDTCSNDLTFHNIRSHYDLAVLEFISQKMRTDIVEIERATKNLYPNGIMIEICMRKIGARVKEQPFVAPFLLRIPSDMTVFELRKEIAKRLARSIRPAPGRRESTPSSTGQSTSEVVANVVGQSHLLPTGDDSDTFGPHELLVIRQTPLTYEPKSEVSNGMSHRTHNRKAEQLGSILTDKNGVERPISTLASPSDEEEKNVVSEYISNHDRVYVNWPLELLERSFDAKEYERVDEQSDSSSRMTTSKNKTKSVLDCIDKFCQQEQLEETEQWYCNKCKRHVRAWKQFHLYRSPPHLIVHLKRFHFSPTTHRRNKITALIDFPLKGLDLSEHVIHWSEYNNDKPVYDCYAVTNHFGGLGGGHYTAFALNPDDTWCLYDDSRITTNIDPKEVVSSAAYVLYYRRRDVPATKEFELDLQTGAAIQFSNGLDIAARPALILNDRESKCHTPTSSRSSSIGGSNAAITDDSARVADDDIRGMEGMTFGDDGITDQQDGSRWSPSRDHQDDSLSVEEDDGDGDQYSDAFLSEGQHVVEEEDVNEDNDDDTADRSFLYRNDDISSNSPFDGDDERPSDHIPLQ